MKDEVLLTRFYAAVLWQLKVATVNLERWDMIWRGL